MLKYSPGRDEQKDTCVKTFKRITISKQQLKIGIRKPDITNHEIFPGSQK